MNTNLYMKKYSFKIEYKFFDEYEDKKISRKHLCKHIYKVKSVKPWNRFCWVYVFYFVIK